MTKRTEKREPVANRPERGGRFRVRLLAALAFSVVLHLALAITMRPDYKPVSDRLVNVTVATVRPGPPKKRPAPPPPGNVPDAPKEKPAEKAPVPAKKPTKITPGNGTGPLSKSPSDEISVADGGPGDGGIPTEDGSEGLAGMGTPEGTGTGICLPDLFPYSPKDATWMLWVSLASFRETSLEASVGGTLGRFAVGSQIQNATGLDPVGDVEGVVVASSDVFKSDTYQVVMGYDSGEAQLKQHMSDQLAGGAPLSWNPQEGGASSVTGNSVWHLAGSGRVLVAATQQAQSSNNASFDPGWPRQPGCLTPETPSPAPDTANTRFLVDLARAFLQPDGSGRMPVALLSTTDPRTVGLGRGKLKGATFEHARIRGFFSDPIVIEGEVQFKGKEAAVVALADEWRAMAATVSKDPFFIMAGLSHLFDHLVISASGPRIQFQITLSEGQARAGMLFLQLQGDVLERHLKNP